MDPSSKEPVTRYLRPGRSVENAARLIRLTIVYRLIVELKLNPRNPRKHSAKQIQQLAESIRAHGFVVPVLIDANDNVVAGHARILAARLLGMAEVPSICLAELTAAQIQALTIADNRLCEIGEWDEHLLAEQLKELAELNLDFSLESTGFSMGEIDFRISQLSSLESPDKADELPAVDDQVQVTQPGDLWMLGRHRLLCGDARDPDAFSTLMQGAVARMVFTDPPYNVPIDGHVCGKGAIKHDDFVMACGEMSADQFTAFLIQALRVLASNICDGALVFVAMDWRHARELLSAGQAVFADPKNLCVWVKDRGGLGTFYRSQHELFFVFKKGTAAHINNFELGQFGRYRTNVWQYPAAASFGRIGEEGDLSALHPTVKPVALVADAILDCSNRGDIVVDSFLGSGTSIIAAERTGRICYGLELDPKYVDVIVRRWQSFTQQNAQHAVSGRTFDEIEMEVKDGHR